MRASGEYNQAFTWKLQSKSVSGTGARPEDFADNGTLWGKLETLSGSEGLAASIRLSQSDAVIRIHGYPALREVDRLLHVRWNETYEITGMVRGDYELICQVTRFRTRQDDV